MSKEIVPANMNHASRYIAKMLYGRGEISKKGFPGII